MQNTQWDVETDVLVIGSGKGAMAAAVSAYEMGCRDVLLVEKADKLGGTSALSGGVIWMPCNRYSRGLYPAMVFAYQAAKHITRYQD